MPTRDELNARRESLRAEVESLESNTEMTVAEKAAKYETLQAEVTKWDQEQKNYLKNGEMLKALGEGGSAAAADFGFGEDMGETIAPLSMRRGEIARAMMKHPMFLANKDRIAKGIDPDHSSYEVVTKDATEANNLVGEGLYGGTGPTAAGQNPFLPGAVGAGIQPDWLPGIVDLKYYPLRFSEILSSFATDSPNLSYLTEATSNRQAAAVAEGAAMRRGRPRPLRLLRRARDRGPPRRQADRRRERGRASALGRAGAAGARQRCPGAGSGRAG